MGIYFYTLPEYVQSFDSMEAKINSLDKLIDLMYDKMLDAIGDSGVAEYQLDDGQMRIRTQYRSMDDILKGIKALETQRQMYINRYNGRSTILRGRLNY